MRANRNNGYPTIYGNIYINCNNSKFSAVNFPYQDPLHAILMFEHPFQI